MLARWRRYWFGDTAAGGTGAPSAQLSVAVLRIAIATSVLMTLWRLGSGYAGDPASAPHSIYRAVGILRLYPGEPGPAAIEVLRVIAWVATLAMLVGFRSRVATAVSLVSALALASYGAAFTPTWSHDHNAPFLAQIAFLGAHGGDALSVDAWLRRRRGLPPPAGHAYQWSVRLVQLAVAVMFASGAIMKLVAGKGTLAWAFSDNLRHHLLVRFDLIGLPRTAAADWLLESAWRWKAAALGNLVSQLAPLGACFAMNRPRLRAVLGACFVLEVVGLGVVMGFWDTQWLPLAAVFVDWDRLAAWWRRRRPAPGPSAPATAPARVARGVPIFVAAFVLYDVVVGFVPAIDQRLNTYPFSSFPMFAQIRARRPYDVHQTYELSGGRLVIVADPPLSPAQNAAVAAHHTYRTMYRERSPAVVRQRLGALLAAARTWFPGHAIRSVRVEVIAIQAPAHPAPARLDRSDLAIVGELDAGGTFRSLLGAIAPASSGWTIAPVPAGLALDGIRFGAHLDNRPERVELAARAVGAAPERGPAEDRRGGSGFAVAGGATWTAAIPPAATVHVVGTVADGRTFLVGQRGR
jgi:hypothetical protein